MHESTGIETYFRDERDPHPRSRRLFAFHRPETLAKWLEEPNTSFFLLPFPVTSLLNSSFALLTFISAMLRGEELNEEIDEKSGFELSAAIV